MSGEIALVAARFAVPARFVSSQPLAGGHINESYVLTFDDAGRRKRYLLQRINDAVFRDPPRLMENIRRVTVHIAARLRAERTADIGRRVLTLVPARDGLPFVRDDAGAYWRMYCFIEEACAYETVQSPQQAEQAARGFGRFQRLLADLPPPRLHETIPNFHDTPRRFETLEATIAAAERGKPPDGPRRLAAARAEIERVRVQRGLASALLNLQRSGAAPERVVHNDAKIGNVLFEGAEGGQRSSFGRAQPRAAVAHQPRAAVAHQPRAAVAHLPGAAVPGEALCVTDLDTVMPGLSLFDFGDMMRSMLCPAAEDERDLSHVEVQLPLFQALARGYLSEAAEFLTRVEREHLVTAGLVITLEQAVRFLTDYLGGDTYYRTSRPKQNLDRCRTQLKLLESMQEQAADMAAIVRQAGGRP